MTNVTSGADLSSSSDALREAFRRRALGAVERMAREASPEMLADALAASTDAGTLARVTADQAASDALRRLEPLVGAIARSTEARVRLIEAAGGLHSSQLVGKLLGITRAAVDKRRAAGRLLALRVRGDWAYPAVQFNEAAVLDGITQILAAMSDASAWSILDFLLTPDGALDGQTPIAALRSGDLGAIRRLLDARATDSFA